MKTSYFANKEIFGKGFRLVSISQSVPKWFGGEQCRDLAPPWWIIKGPIEKYEENYRKHVLGKLDPRQIFELFKDSILLCYEKPGDFCHRRIVAKWIEENTGEVVEEFGAGITSKPWMPDPGTKVKSEPERPGLFDNL